MKVTYFVSAILAALVSAQPVPDQEEFALDYASGNVTGELAPQLVPESLSGRSLEKRSNVEFIVYTSSCKLALALNLQMES